MLPYARSPTQPTRGGAPLDALVTHALRLESFVIVGFQLPLTHVTVWPEKFRRRQSCVAGGWSTSPPHMTAGRKFRRRQGMCHVVDGAWAELGLPKKMSSASLWCAASSKPIFRILPTELVLHPFGRLPPANHFSGFYLKTKFRVPLVCCLRQTKFQNSV